MLRRRMIECQLVNASNSIRPTGSLRVCFHVSTRLDFYECTRWGDFSFGFPSIFFFLFSVQCCAMSGWVVILLVWLVQLVFRHFWLNGVLQFCIPTFSVNMVFYLLFSVQWFPGSLFVSISLCWLAKRVLCAI